MVSKSTSVKCLLSAVFVLAGCSGTIEGEEPVVANGPGVDVQALSQGGEVDASAIRDIIARENIRPLVFSPQDPNKVELGRNLYFDRILSGNRDTACATCHLPGLGTGDALSLSAGTGAVIEDGKRRWGPGREIVPRNAPEIFVRGQREWATMFWDGRVAEAQYHYGYYYPGFVSPAGSALPSGLDNVLAVQAMFPPTSRAEMRGIVDDAVDHNNEIAAIPDSDLPAIWEALTARLMAIPAYQQMFADAFPFTPPFEIGFQHAANAIAAFEIEAFSDDDSPWDRFVAGDDSALDAAQRRGAALFFGDAGCSDCHSGKLFTDQQFHNIAVPQLGPGKDASGLDRGRWLETGDPADLFAFRTPPLRNVALSGPWMHNGAYHSLEDAVRHHLNPVASLARYDSSQLEEPLQPTVKHWKVQRQMLRNLDDRVRKPRKMSDAEIDDLLAFLGALTSPSSTQLYTITPTSVPSGLPVDN